MIVGGLLLGFFCTRHLLKAVAEEAEVAQLAQQLHAKEALLLQAAEVEQQARDVAVAVDSMEQAEEALNDMQGATDEVCLILRPFHYISTCRFVAYFLDVIA
jgi:hypothetical protein